MIGNYLFLIGLNDDFLSILNKVRHSDDRFGIDRLIIELGFLMKIIVYN